MRRGPQTKRLLEKGRALEDGGYPHEKPEGDGGSLREKLIVICILSVAAILYMNKSFTTTLNHVPTAAAPDAINVPNKFSVEGEGSAINAATRRDAASFTPQPPLQDPFKPFKPFSSSPSADRAERAVPARSQRKRNALDPLADKAAHHRARAAQINRDADMEREERVLKQEFDLKNPLPKLTDGYEYLDNLRAGSRASKAGGGKPRSRRGSGPGGGGKTPAADWTRTQPSMQPGGKFGIENDGEEFLVSGKEPLSEVDVVGDERDTENVEDKGTSAGSIGSAKQGAVAKKKTAQVDDAGGGRRRPGDGEWLVQDLQGLSAGEVMVDAASVPAHEARLSHLAAYIGFKPKLTPGFHPEVKNYFVTGSTYTVAFRVEVRAMNPRSFLFLNNKFLGKSEKTYTFDLTIKQTGGYQTHSIMVKTPVLTDTQNAVDVPWHHHGRFIAETYYIHAFRRADQLDFAANDNQLFALEAMTEGEKAEVLPKFSSESRVNNYLIPVGNHRNVLEIEAMAREARDDLVLGGGRSAIAARAAELAKEGNGNKVSLLLAAHDPTAALYINRVKVPAGAERRGTKIQPITLQEGENQVNVTVVALDGSLRDYVINIERAQSDVVQKMNEVVRGRMDKAVENLPADERTFVEGRMNHIIRQASRRCHMAPNPWVPLLGPLLSDDDVDLPSELVRARRRSRADTLLHAAESKMQDIRDQVSVLDQITKPVQTDDPGWSAISSLVGKLDKLKHKPADNVQKLTEPETSPRAAEAYNQPRAQVRETQDEGANLDQDIPHPGMTDTDVAVANKADTIVGNADTAGADNARNDLAGSGKAGGDKADAGVASDDNVHDDVADANIADADVTGADDANTGEGGNDVANADNASTGEGDDDVANADNANTGKGGNDVANADNANTGEEDNDVANADNANTGEGEDDVANADNANTGKGGNDVANADNANTGKGGNDVANADNANTGEEDNDVADADNANTGEGGNDVANADSVNRGEGEDDVANADDANTGEGGNDVANADNVSTQGAVADKADTGFDAIDKTDAVEDPESAAEQYLSPAASLDQTSQEMESGGDKDEGDEEVIVEVQDRNRQASMEELIKLGQNAGNIRDSNGEQQTSEQESSEGSITVLQGDGNGWGSGDFGGSTNGEAPNSSSSIKTTAKDYPNTKYEYKDANEDVPSALGLEHTSAEDVSNRDVQKSVLDPQGLLDQGQDGASGISETAGRAHISGMTEDDTYRLDKAEEEHAPSHQTQDGLNLMDEGEQEQSAQSDTLEDEVSGVDARAGEDEHVPSPQTEEGHLSPVSDGEQEEIAKTDAQEDGSSQADEGEEVEVQPKAREDDVSSEDMGEQEDVPSPQTQDDGSSQADEGEEVEVQPRTREDEVSSVDMGEEEDVPSRQTQEDGSHADEVEEVEVQRRARGDEVSSMDMGEEVDVPSRQTQEGHLSPVGNGEQEEIAKTRASEGGSFHADEVEQVEVQPRAREDEVSSVDMGEEEDVPSHQTQEEVLASVEEGEQDEAAALPGTHEDQVGQHAAHPLAHKGELSHVHEGDQDQLLQPQAHEADGEFEVKEAAQHRLPHHQTQDEESSQLGPEELRAVMQPQGQEDQVSLVDKQEHVETSQQQALEDESPHAEAGEQETEHVQLQKEQGHMPAADAFPQAGKIEQVQLHPQGQDEETSQAHGEDEEEVAQLQSRQGEFSDLDDGHQVEAMQSPSQEDELSQADKGELEDAQPKALDDEVPIVDEGAQDQRPRQHIQEDEVSEAEEGRSDATENGRIQEDAIAKADEEEHEEAAHPQSLEDESSIVNNGAQEVARRHQTQEGGSTSINEGQEVYPTVGSLGLSADNDVSHQKHRKLLQTDRRPARTRRSRGSEPVVPAATHELHQPREQPSPDMSRLWLQHRSEIGSLDETGLSLSLSKDDLQMANCMRDLKKCELRPDDMFPLVRGVKIAKLLKRPLQCLAVKTPKKGQLGAPIKGGCDKLTGNFESGHFVEAPEAIKLPELSGLEAVKFDKCALVGSGQAIRQSMSHGFAVDRHDAVFRFNLAPTQKYEHFVGNKTTFRVFDSKTAEALASGQANAWGVYPPERGERWVFWHYQNLLPNHARKGQLSDVQAIQKRFPHVQMHLLSPELINWELEVYFEMMTMAVKFGLAPKAVHDGTTWGYSTPVTMSSGAHTALLASRLCKTVNLFGFSHDPRGKWIAQPDHYYKNIEPIAIEDWVGSPWQFEAWMLRMLHLGNSMNMCTSS